MGRSIVKIQANLLREYYKDFSKFARGKSPEKKVAWVTSFTPIEILEALEISYCYPESYAAVIAASGKEQQLLEESEKQFLTCDCCSYSCCIEGCVQTGEGPRGVLPKPDVLIATNNQCGTLPNWWNILSERYNIPLIVLDYPGENADRNRAYEYVTAQHQDFIAQMEKLSGNKLDENVLSELISNSARSVAAWGRILSEWASHDVKPTAMFDDISFLITSRCKTDTAELYNMMADEIIELPTTEGGGIPAFWLGYPLWYHPDRYLSELLDGFKIVGSNYITWWNLDYSGKSNSERLFNAYNYTFLNLSQRTRTKRLTEMLKESGAKCAVTLHNKSCKCDFVSARDIAIPQAELEIDMIDRKFADIARAKEKIDLLKETLCGR